VNTNIRSHHVSVSRALESHCRERVERALSPFAGRVRRVEVVLADVNGPRRGPGHVCRMFVDLTDGATLIFATASHDFYRAVTATAAGLSRQLAKTLERKTSRSHERFLPLDVA
jgi:putative sigma-54 modulation protein